MKERLTKNQIWFILVALFALFFFGWEYYEGDAAQSKSILYISGTDTYDMDGNVSVEKVLSGDGDDPIEVLEDMVFLDASSTPLFAFYSQGDGDFGSGKLGDDFNKVLVIETVSLNNTNFMGTAFFDGINGRPTFVVNQGTSTRASVFENSLIVGIGASTTLDATYTSCATHGAIFIDCGLLSIDGEGDLFVADDVEIGGDLFVRGTIHRPMAKVTKSSDQSIPQNTLTMVTWDEEKYDTDDMHSTSTNNTRITFNTAGVYSVLAQSEWGTNSGGFRFLDLMKNGVSVGRSRDLAENASEHNVAFVGEFEVNDYIELQVFQDTGGNLDFESGAIIENTYLEAHKID